MCPLISVLLILTGVLFYLNGEREFYAGTNWVSLKAFNSRDRGRMPKALAWVIKKFHKIVWEFDDKEYLNHYLAGKPFFDLRYVKDMYYKTEIFKPERFTLKKYKSRRNYGK